MATVRARSHGGASLAHDRRGTGPALVLIHPLGGDRRVWDPVVPALAGSRTVITVDLPGFGDSPPLRGETPTPAALARATEGFLGELDLDRPHVAGNSLGGWVAFELALAGRARSVTAIAPAGLWAGPLEPKRALARAFARAAGPAVGLLTGTEAGRRALLGGVMVHPERVPPAAAAHVVRAYAAAPGFLAANRAMRAGHFADLERIEVPVTLGWPNHDRLVSRPARLPPQVHSRVLRDCGHLPMWDAPDEVAALLLEGSASE
jgi:pimeloyl-ACP methyl ester carboxylesterase